MYGQTEFTADEVPGTQEPPIPLQPKLDFVKSLKKHGLREITPERKGTPTPNTFRPYPSAGSLKFSRSNLGHSNYAQPSRIAHAHFASKVADKLLTAIL